MWHWARLLSAIAGLLASAAPVFAFHPLLNCYYQHHHSGGQTVQSTRVTTQFAAAPQTFTLQLAPAPTTTQATTQTYTLQLATAPVTTQTYTLQLATAPATTQATTQSIPIDLGSLLGGLSNAATNAQLATLSADVKAIRTSTASIDANLAAFVKGTKPPTTPTTGTINAPITSLESAPLPARTVAGALTDIATTNQAIVNALNAQNELLKALVAKLPPPQKME